MNRETIAYQVDGLTIKSEIFSEARLALRGGLGSPEADGLNRHAISRAEHLTSLGYVAMACDLHGDAKVVEDLGVSIGMLDPRYADPGP